MSLNFAVQTFFEILLIMGVIIGMMYDSSIAEWEQKLLKKLKGRKKNGRVQKTEDASTW